MDRSSKYINLIILSFCLFTSGCNLDFGHSEETNTAAQHLSQAEQYVKIGQLRAAWIELKNAQSQDPNSQEIAVKMASFLNDLGQGKQAYKVLQKHLDDKSLDVDIAAATALLKQGKFHSAIDYINERYPGTKTPALIKILADAQLALGKTNEAGANYKRLTDHNNKVDGIIGLSKIAANRGQLDVADKKLDEVLSLDPENVEALILKALIAEKREDLDQAEGLLSKALQYIPDSDIIGTEKRIVLTKLAKILTKLGRTTESLIYTKLLAEANPEAQEFSSKYNEALEELKANNIESAQKDLVDIYKKTQDDSSGALLGLISFMQNDMETADQYLSQHVDPETASFPELKAFIVSKLQLRKTEQLLSVFGPKERSRIKNPELKALLAIALIVNGQKQEGEELLDEAIKLAPQNASLRLIQAQQLLASKEFDAAINNLKTASELDPTNIQIKTRLLQTLLKLKRTDEALRLAKQFVQDQPSNPSAHVLLGNLNVIINDETEARKSFQKALELAKDNTEAQFGIAILDARAGHLQDSQTRLLKIVKAEPENAKAIRALIAVSSKIKASPLLPSELLNFANGSPSEIFATVASEYFLRLNQLDNSEKFLKYIDESSTNSYALAVKQEFFFKQAQENIVKQQFADARTSIIDGLAINPNNLRLLDLLTNLEIKTGQLIEADKLIRQIENIPNSEQVATLLRARYFVAKQSPELAEAEYRKLWQSRKDNSIAKELFANLAKTSPDNALAFTREWKQEIPNSADAHLNEAMLLQNKGLNDRAIASYETVLKLEPQLPVALNNLAWLYKDRNLDKAVELAQRAYTNNKKSAAIADTYGWLLVQSGKKKEGVDILTLASEMAPDNADIQAHLNKARSAL